MGIISSSKSIGSVTAIPCNGTVEVTIAIEAAPNILDNPTDIALVLDRSGSMAGQSLADLKTGVNAFIDIIANATGGAPDEIGSDSHIGIVSFAATATEDTGLSTSVADLKAATDALTADGLTNHSDAFSKAMDMLSVSTNAKVIVLFTDGVTTAGPVATPFADAAKAAGITIYCIGLEGTDGVDIPLLESWVSTPSSTHFAFAPTSDQLEQIFANLARNITLPGATDIELVETLDMDFEILGSIFPSVGSVVQLTERSFRWNIDELGVTETETAEVVFTAQHVGSTTGVKEINDSLTYSDAEGNVVTFGNPEVFVNCEEGFVVNACPVVVEADFDGCQQFLRFDAGTLTLENAGRILELDVTLLNVCPGKRVAVAVVLTEEDEGDILPRGLKTFTVPAHDGPSCTDIEVRCIRFILPEDGGVLCPTRTLRAQFMAHYVDFDFECCPPIPTSDTL